MPFFVVYPLTCSVFFRPSEVDFFAVVFFVDERVVERDDLVAVVLAESGANARRATRSRFSKRRMVGENSTRSENQCIAIKCGMVSTYDGWRIERTSADL